MKKKAKMSQDIFTHLQKPKGRERLPNPNPVKYLGTIWWVLRTYSNNYIMITSGVSWPSRWADASLAATTTKVYFTVHLRLQDCNTWLGIRAAMTGSREQRGVLWWSEGWCGRRVHFTTLCKAAADISGPVRCVAEATVRGISPSSSSSWSKIMRTFEGKKYQLWHHWLLKTGISLYILLISFFSDF